MGSSSRFWNKVESCKHKNLSPDYCEGVYCSTPYCGGYEVHCLDCGVYISTCGCLCCDGMSGWPEARWRKRRMKREEEYRKKLAERKCLKQQ